MSYFQGINQNESLSDAYEGVAVVRCKPYPLLGRVGKGDPLCSNELHQPLCLRRAMPQLIEAILTMNPIINITSPR